MLYAIKYPNMKTTITEVTLLGTSITAGLSGLVNDYGGFLVTVGSSIFLAVIRWQEHRANLRKMDIEAKIMESKLKDKDQDKD